MKTYLIAFIFLTGLGWYTVYTLAWQRVTNALGIGTKFSKLFRIKLAGEANNTLHLTNFISGDLLRIKLLSKEKENDAYSLSVIIDRTIHSLAVLSLIVTAIVLCFINFRSQPSNIRFGIPIATIAVLIFIAFVSIRQRRGVFGIFIKICRRIGLGRKFSEQMVERFEELDSHIIDFYDEHRLNFGLSFLLHLFGRFLGLVEIFLLGKIFYPDFSPILALLLGALVPIANALTPFVPGAIGIMELTFSLVFWAFGMDPMTGLIVQLARRARFLLWMGIGMFMLTKDDRRQIYSSKICDEL